MNGERGYTLVEMVVAMAVVGIIAAILALAVHQIISVPEKGNDKVAAVHDMQGAAYWLGNDITSAQSATSDADSLTLTLPDASVIEYLWADNMFCRYVNGEGMTLATSIDSVDFTIDDRLITVNITAAPDNRWDISENQTYRIAMRPAGT